MGISVRFRPLRFSLLFLILSLMLSTVILRIGLFGADGCESTNRNGRRKSLDKNYFPWGERRRDARELGTCRWSGQSRKSEDGNKRVNTLNLQIEYTYISVGLTRVKSANIARCHRYVAGGTLPIPPARRIIVLAYLFFVFRYRRARKYLFI